MPKRGENIYKRKDGRWEGRHLKANGKYVYVYGKSYKEVKEKKVKLQINATEANSVENRENPEMLHFSEQLEQWLTECVSKRVKPSTYENYYYCTKKYLIPYFNRELTKQLTEKQLKEFMNYLDKNEDLSETYKKKIICIFKTAVKDICHGNEHMEVLYKTLKYHKCAKKEVQVFSIREQQAIEKVLLDKKEVKAIGIMTCFYTGIRLGELCALRWQDINWEARYIYINSTITRIKNFSGEGTKTKLVVGMPKSTYSVRKIPLPDFLYNMFNNYDIHSRNLDYFILSDSISPMDPRTIQRYYEKVVLTAGVNYRKFHAIRHTFATRALEMGIDIKTLSELLGHSSVTITLNIYAHSLMEQKKLAIEKMNMFYITRMTPTVSTVNNSVNY